MRAIGEHETEQIDETDDGAAPRARPGRAAMVALLRGVLSVIGALTLVGGLTWLLLNLHGPQPAVDLLVGVVLTVGGLVLLMPHRVRLPWFVGATGAVVAAIVGPAIGLLMHRTQQCCGFAYVDGRGFPFPLMQRAGAGNTPEAARGAALGSPWQIDLVSLVTDVFFWAYAGLLIVVFVALARRALRARGSAIPAP